MFTRIYNCIAHKGNSQNPDLDSFYSSHYKRLVPPNETIIYTNLSQILKYAAIDSIKNIKNNIIYHFEQHLRKFVRCLFRFNEQKKFIQTTYPSDQRKPYYQALHREIDLFYNDILPTTQVLQSDPKHHHRILFIRQSLFPFKFAHPDKNLLYNLKVQDQTMKYLRPMFSLHILCETYLPPTSPYSFNVLPLKTSTAPGYITIDTRSMIELLFGKGEDKTQCKKDFTQDNNKYEYWNKKFDLNQRAFKTSEKNAFEFHYMILTDGVGCSVLFSTKKPAKKTKTTKNTETETEPADDKYFADLAVKPDLIQKNLVCIDPGRSDLIYCADNSGKTFRYTQNQRRKELRTKKYRYIRQSVGKNVEAPNIDGQRTRLKVFEDTLSKYTAKTCDLEKFAQYCYYKNWINYLLQEHYSNPIFRKLKFYSYINRQKSESKMLKNFERNSEIQRIQ